MIYGCIICWLLIAVVRGQNNLQKVVQGS